jgi:hypothetical protein
MIQLVMADNSEQITAQYIPSQETRVAGEKGSTTTNIFSFLVQILYCTGNPT